MIIFNTDLDNTMIYSYKHDIGEDKLCAEIYEGREISFVTRKTSELIKKANSAVMLVPTTTRTFEQYSRIDLGIGTPEYALVCNGGVLIVNGAEDEEWSKISYSMVEDCQDQLALAEKYLETDENRCMEVRNIRNLFVFTKSTDPNMSIERLKSKLDTDKVDVFYTGIKVYVVPKTLGKGNAIERLRKKLGGDLVIAAGDSEFDVSMLDVADVAIAPETLASRAELKKDTYVVSKEYLFSEKVLEKVLEVAENYKSE